MLSDFRAQNQRVISELTSQDANLRKEASLGVDEWLRTKAHEESFMDLICTPDDSVTVADCDKQVDSVKLVKVKDREPNLPPSASIPFGVVPADDFIGTSRYRVVFQRIATSRFRADSANLMTYDMDIREVFNNLMLFTILDEVDTKAMGVIDANLGSKGDTAGDRYITTGSKGWIDVGAMTRTSLALGWSGLSASTNSLHAAKALANTQTMWQVVAQTREEVGGDYAETTFLEGPSAIKKLGGIEYVVTIKKSLVATGDMYFFAGDKYLGDNLIMEDVTMVTNTDGPFIEFWAHTMRGAAFANIAAFCKASFGGSADTWE